MISANRHILMMTALMALGGCYYDVEAELYPGRYCDLENVTWTNTIQPIIQTECAVPGCHVSGGTGPGDFTTYTGVKGKVDNGSFGTVVLVERSMPPNNVLDQCELDRLQQWVDAGAPQN